MGKDAFDRKIAAIELARQALESEAIGILGKALKDRSGYATARAATVASSRSFVSLIPDLIAGFERFLRDGVKTDPQCLAKIAIVKALRDLGYDEAGFYFAGTRYFQNEPAWGGSVDTAGTVRGECAHALVACRTDSYRILLSLTDLLCDPLPPVRADAARAIAQLSAREGAFPLRIKLRAGDPEPEVVGHCFAALLSLSSADHLAFVISFLDHADPDVRIEAAGVLSESREPAALAAVIQYFNRQTEPSLRNTLLSLIAASPLPESASFLRSLGTEAAAEALRHSRHAPH